MGYWNQRQGRTCRIGPLILGTITPICQQKGFVQARILLEWEYILTPAFSQFCEPIKVTFPFKQRDNGCLFLRATSSMATEIAYLENHILNAINQYFGYKAIGKISIQQGPVKRSLSKESKNPHPLPEETKQHLESQVQAIEDERLRAVLLSLGTGISSRQV